MYFYFIFQWNSVSNCCLDLKYLKILQKNLRRIMEEPDINNRYDIASYVVVLNVREGILELKQQRGNEKGKQAEQLGTPTCVHACSQAYGLRKRAATDVRHSRWTGKGREGGDTVE
jgi:hypothetical protein